MTGPTVRALIDFSDDAGDAKRSCMYFEVRRSSTNAVLATHGSSASPICESGAVPRANAIALPEVASATVANDLKLRIFVTDEGGNKTRFGRVAVAFVAYGKTWTLLPTSYDDRVGGTSAPAPWGPARADGVAWREAADWPSTYTATRYASFTFPNTVPGAATITSASLEHRWRTANGARHCLFYEVWAGGVLLAGHGSSAAPASCKTGTSNSTDTVPLPEVDTAAEAGNLTIKVFAWGGNRTEHDIVALHLNYSLGPAGCADPRSETVLTTRDSSTDQSAPTSVSGGTANDLRVKSQSGARNRRTYLYFDLPAIGDGCTLTGAALRAYMSASQGTRQITAARATAPWTEAGLNWSNQPALSGAVGDANGPGWHQWSVTSLVQAMYANGNYGFGLKDSVEDAATAAEQRLDAREKGANTAQLVLTYG